MLFNPLTEYDQLYWKEKNSYFLKLVSFVFSMFGWRISLLKYTLYSAMTRPAVRCNTLTDLITYKQYRLLLCLLYFLSTYIWEPIRALLRRLKYCYRISVWDERGKRWLAGHGSPIQTGTFTAKRYINSKPQCFTIGKSILWHLDE